MERAARILTSTGFLAGLVLLLVNDFVLKEAYPGLITGKLSDFAGLFIFPMFWSALFPCRTRAIYLATALGFVWWKSPLSQGAIDGWNAIGLYEIARVVDYTDLAALIVLAPSIQYLQRKAEKTNRSLLVRTFPIVLLVAPVAFMATSYAGKSYDYGPKEDNALSYVLPFPVEEFPQRLDDTGLWHDYGYEIELESRCQ